MSTEPTSRPVTTFTIPFESQAFPFAAVCDALNVCENTGRKLVREGKLVTFRVGKRHMATGRAIIECQDLLVKTQRRAVRS